MAKHHLNRHWLKVGLAGLGAIAATGGALALVKPPALTPVAVLAHPVAAMTPVPASDVTWVRMEHPPQGTVTAWAGQPLVAHSLPAGTVLTVSDFTSAAQSVGLKANEVRYVVPITAASAVITLGSRVDVWSLPTTTSTGSTTPQELALGVRVIGLYTAQGTPISTEAASGGFLSSGSSAPQPPALAALAVPRDVLPTMMAENPNQTVLLISDPGQTQFALITPSSSGISPGAILPAGTPAGDTPSPTTSPSKTSKKS